MTKRINYTRVEDFLRDDDFIRYALEDCIADGCSSQWDSYASNPCNTVRNAFQKAVYILQNLDDCTLLSADEMAALKARIFRTLKLSGN